MALLIPEMSHTVVGHRPIITQVVVVLPALLVLVIAWRGILAPLPLRGVVRAEIKVRMDQG